MHLASMYFFFLYILSVSLQCRIHRQIWKEEPEPGKSLQQAPIRVCSLKNKRGKREGEGEGSNFPYMLLFCLMKIIDNIMDFS